MSTYHRLFYTYKFGNRVRCIFIFIFLCSRFFRDFHTIIWYQVFLIQIICIPLYGIKYSYLIQIIIWFQEIISIIQDSFVCTQLYLVANIPIQLMGHSSACLGISGTDLVECVMSLDMVVSRGWLARVPGRPSIRVTRPRLTILEHQGGRFPSSNSTGGGRFIAWRLRHPLFKGIPMGPKTFLGMFGVSRLQTCAQTLLKRPCATHFRLVRRVNTIV